jgi:hypothetical protein
MEEINKTITNEVSMWRTVLEQAFLDLASFNPKIKEEAMIWFDLVNEDYIEVCTNARVDPVKVLEYQKLHLNALQKHKGLRQLLRPKIGEKND